MRAKLRNLKSLFILFLALGPAQLALTQTPDQPRQKFLKLGVLLPLTGPTAEIGEWTREGLAIAEDELRAEGWTLELIIEDDRCNGTGAVSAFRNLRDHHKVPAVLGPVCNAASVPLLRIANQEQVPILVGGFANRTVIAGGDFVFTPLPSVHSLAASLPRFAKSKGQSSLSIVHVEDEFGEECANAMEESAKQLSLKVLSRDSFQGQSPDVRAQLLRMATKKPDALLAAGYVPHYVTLIQQLQALHWTKPVYAMQVIQSPATSRAGAGLNFPVRYIYPSAPTSPAFQKLLTTWQAKHPELKPQELSLYVASGYDNLRLYAKAAEHCAGEVTSFCLQEGLLEIRNFDGANGRITFDAEGNFQGQANLELRELGQ